MSSSESIDDTVVHDDIPVPSYDALLNAAIDLEAAEDLALSYRQYASPMEREWFYDSKDAALQAVKDACTAGKAAEANVTPDQLNDPTHPSFAYKTLRSFTRFALLSISNFNARADYIRSIADYASRFGRLIATNTETAARAAVAVRNMGRQAFLAKTSASNQLITNLIASKQHDFGGILDFCRERIHPGIPFNQLNQAQKAQVFTEMVACSGRSNFAHDLLYQVEGVIGWAVIITTLSILVYDIVQSQTDFVDQVGKILGDAATLGAVWVGAAAAEAVAIATFGSEAFLTITLFGLCGGTIAGLAVMGVVASLAVILDDMSVSTSREMWDRYLSTPIVYKVKLPLLEL
ncbi:hypothetical protein BD410DRAFT_797272, partial [Rickenella mellea]